MSCRAVGKLLPLVVGGEVSAKERNDIASHLAACESCRALESELAESRAWLQSAAAPALSETESAALRRGVWSQIQRRSLHRVRGGSFFPRLLAASAVLAAAFAALLVFRARPVARSSDAVVRSARPVIVAAPAPEIASRIAAPSNRQEAAPPKASIAGFHESSGVARIEFQTANPNVRIIWLVRKGEKTLSAPASRSQEVS